MICAICQKRREKRFCPAIHGRICPQCCGEQREVTLDCPSDCVYLQQAREHEKPRGMADVNPSDIFLQVDIGDEFLYQREHLIMGLSFARQRVGSIRDVPENPPSFPRCHPGPPVSRWTT